MFNKMHISEVTDEQLFNEIYKCKVAQVLLYKSAYKKQWRPYEVALNDEIKRRNEPMDNLTDEQLLDELFS